MIEEVKEISQVQFGVLSEEEVLKMSVAEIHKNKLPGGKTIHQTQHELLYHTLYDPRMGPMEPRKTCITCQMETKDCPGHFGHILLNIKIVHPLFYKFVLSFLKCFCIQCSKLLFTEEHIKLWGLSKMKGETRFNHLIEMISRIRFCSTCSIYQPKYTINTQDGSFMASYKMNNQVNKVKITTDEIFQIFSKIPIEAIETLGFDSLRTHPKNFILNVLPVLPPRSRPFIVADNIVSDDDLTIGYCEIIKANNNIKNPNISESKRQKYIDTLIFRIKTLFDNSSGKAKHTNSRPIKGIKERLSGKDGLIRCNLMGKRVNFSARTVVGPDVTLRLNEMAVPNEICDIESYPEKVNSHNIRKLQEMVWKGDVNMIDKPNPNLSLQPLRRIHTKFALQSEMRESLCKLEIGDIVHRKLQTGDIVLMNRQPTLHKGSMLAKRVVRRKAKTFRLNLATTASFNADFDGDEMNIFVPQSEPARAELEILSETQNNMIGVQSSNSIITIVQDALLSCYLMTKNPDEIPRETFFQLIMKCDTELNTPGGLSFDLIQHKLKIAQSVYQKYGKSYPLYSGKTLFSLLLPDDFMYTSNNKAMSEEPILKIEKGIVYEGAVNKADLKGGQKSILCLLYKEYSVNTALHFINNVQFLANEYVLYHGFSIGIGDCLTDVRKTKKIDEIITKCFLEAQGHEETTMNPYIKEARVNMSLSKAKDIGMRIAKESLKPDNNFISTVTSGSKGDYFNIAQVMGLLGQQNIEGYRLQAHLNKGRRTLPCYPYQISKEEEYVSKGFIRNSFLKGLTPQEFWFHAMSGREGITDTAMKTANSGYTQRKMVKITEDVQIKYDQTVRNSVGSIIQFAYGEDNLDGSKTILDQNEPFICNINRLAERLNAQYELETN